MAVSTDKHARQADFKRSIGAPFSFVADTEGSLTRQFEVKTPFLTLAKRVTFVIGKGREILHVDSGGRAIDPSGAAEACALY